jgi:hypothetical protein
MPFTEIKRAYGDLRGIPTAFQVIRVRWGAILVLLLDRGMGFNHNLELLQVLLLLLAHLLGLSAGLLGSRIALIFFLFDWLRVL